MKLFDRTDRFNLGFDTFTTHKKWFFTILLVVSLVFCSVLAIWVILQNTQPGVGSEPKEIANTDLELIEPTIVTTTTIMPGNNQENGSSTGSNSTNYGFAKLIDLPGIGVRAKFPQDTKISYRSRTSYYQANFDGKKEIVFTMHDFPGGSRRAWFAKEILSGSSGDYEAFSSQNSSGYIYSNTKSQYSSAYSYYYFTVVGNKMLVIRTDPTDMDLNKFKAFIKTVELINTNPVGVERADQNNYETMRWSDQRKVIWEDTKLGLRITGPEWIESRLYRTTDTGEVVFSDWTRTNTVALASEFGYGKSESGQGFVISGPPFGGTHIYFLDSKYTGQSFDVVASEILPGAGYCAGGWSESLADCASDNPDFCYTKSDVLKNLKLYKTEKFGPYTGQMRELNSDFSAIRDCRGENIWLIKAKGGQYVMSTIYPSSETIKLEGF